MACFRLNAGMVQSGLKEYDMGYVRMVIVAMVLAFGISGSVFGQTTRPTEYRQRLVFFMDNLDRPENVEKIIPNILRAAKAGYTHIVITDCKFFRWKEYEGRGYVEKAQKVRQAIKDAGLKFIAICCDQTSDLLSNDPSLAEGTPVVDAPFVVKDGQLVPADNDFVLPKIELAPGGEPIVRQTIKVKPYRYYYISAMVKTEDLEKARSFDMPIVGATVKQGLSHRMYGVKPTQDWTKIETTFNTMDNEQVTLSVGTFGRGKGKLWVKDIHVESGGLVNLVRREALPVKVTSADGQTIYEEGKDIERVTDPKANMAKWPGDHDMWPEKKPLVKIIAGGRIKEGDTVLISYHISQMSYSWGVFACPAEPKTMELVKWQVAQIHKNLQPDGYMMAHDEIRHWGQDPSCIKTGKTPGQIMAQNVKQCYQIIQAEDAGKPVYVWSDMFDPTHNATKKGQPYYLCRGVDPWIGSWEGLDPKVNMILWWGGNPKRAESTAFFVNRGHNVILSTSGDLMPAWMEECNRTGGGIGTMFTVWDNKYDKLEAFGKMLDDWKPGKYQPTTRPSSDLE